MRRGIAPWGRSLNRRVQSISVGPMDVQANLTLSFKRGQASADELQAIVDGILKDLRDPTTEVAARAKEEDLDSAEVGSATITVKETDQGFGPLVVAIVFAITTEVGKDAMMTAWKKIIAPQIEKRRDGLALGDELPEPSDVEEGEAGEEGPGSPPRP